MAHKQRKQGSIGCTMINWRTYGHAPFSIAVVHGGPGAGGEMAPVARELASEWGILEPLQTATSLDGQIQELKQTLIENGQPPMTLIGYSWGAWLAFLTAADHPDLVDKLVLVGSGPFEASYVEQLGKTRMGRLNEIERAEFQASIERLSDPDSEDKNTALARLGSLAFKTDSYDPLPDPRLPDDRSEVQSDIFGNIWPAAAELRQSGELLARCANIRCPVVAIHGDYDPHPAEGVNKPLAAHLSNFEFILLEHCGHTPWVEKQAKHMFYKRLRDILHQGGRP